MPYAKPGKLLKRVQKAVRRRKVKHQQAIRNAKTIAKKAERAQLVIAKSQPKMTAGELVGSGEWNWEGAGLSPDTLMEAQWTGSGWEYVPAKDQSRKSTGYTRKGKGYQEYVEVRTAAQLKATDQLPLNGQFDDNQRFEAVQTEYGTRWVPEGQKARPTVVHSSSTDGKRTTLGRVRRDRSIHLTEDPDYPDDTPVYMINGSIHLADVVDGNYSAAQCRGRTKDGTPCRNVGNCPIPSHRRNKV